MKILIMDSPDRNFSWDLNHEKMWDLTNEYVGHGVPWTCSNQETSYSSLIFIDHQIKSNQIRVCMGLHVPFRSITQVRNQTCVINSFCG